VKKIILIAILMIGLSGCVVTTQSRMYPDWEDVEATAEVFGKCYPDSTRKDAVDAFKWGVIWLQKYQIRSRCGREMDEF
jgi:hypothetical protein